MPRTVNDQWRIVFRWSDGDASEIRLVDSHRPRASMPCTRSARHRPVCLGAILREECPASRGISIYRLAEDTALRLAAYFGTTAEFRINPQARDDLEVPRDSGADRAIAKIRPFKAA